MVDFRPCEGSVIFVRGPHLPTTMRGPSSFPRILHYVKRHH